MFARLTQGLENLGLKARSLSARRSAVAGAKRRKRVAARTSRIVFSVPAQGAGQKNREREEAQSRTNQSGAGQNRGVADPPARKASMYVIEEKDGDHQPVHDALHRDRTQRALMRDCRRARRNTGPRRIRRAGRARPGWP